jgi:hypothetical protein
MVAVVGVRVTREQTKRPVLNVRRSGHGGYHQWCGSLYFIHALLVIERYRRKWNERYGSAVSGLQTARAAQAVTAPLASQHTVLVHGKRTTT